MIYNKKICTSITFSIFLLVFFNNNNLNGGRFELKAEGGHIQIENSPIDFDGYVSIKTIDGGKIKIENTSLSGPINLTAKKGEEVIYKNGNLIEKKESIKVFSYCELLKQNGCKVYKILDEHKKFVAGGIFAIVIIGSAIYLLYNDARLVSLKNAIIKHPYITAISLTTILATTIFLVQGCFR